MLVEVIQGEELPVLIERKYKQTGQKFRLVDSVAAIAAPAAADPAAVVAAQAAAKRHEQAGLKKGLILHSLQGQNCQGMDQGKYDELIAQRPVRLVFRRKFSDLAKQTEEEAAAGAGQQPRGLGLRGLVGGVVR